MDGKSFPIQSYGSEMPVFAEINKVQENESGIETFRPRPRLGALHENPARRETQKNKRSPPDLSENDL